MEEVNLGWASAALILAFFVYGSAAAYHSISKLQIEIERSSTHILSRIFIWVCGKPLCFSVFLRVFEFLSAVGYVAAISMGEPSWFFWTLALLVYIAGAWGVSGFLFRLAPTILLKWVSPLIGIPYTLFYPLWLGISAWISPQNGQEQRSYADEVVEESLSDLCENYEPSTDCSTEVKMVQNVMELRKSKVRDCMVPRNEMIQTSDHTSIPDLVKLFTQTGLSKILVYKKEMGQIIGYVHAYDLFQEVRPRFIEDILRSVYSVPESIASSILLRDMIEKRKSIAVVFDEFGTVSGLVTLEDLMEEIFGEIEDEFDTAKEELKVGEDSFEISARLKIDYLNEHYALCLPESEEYDTLGGLITTSLQRIPKAGEEVDMASCVVKVMKASEIRVEKVLVRLKV